MVFRLLALNQLRYVDNERSVVGSNLNTIPFSSTTYHGGTNFGRTAGGPFIATSYDYDAPLDEYGLLRQPIWGHLNDLHRAIKLCEPALVSGDPTLTRIGTYQEVLVVQEISGKFGGTGVWKMPTGVVNEGEDISDDVIREVKEETGIETKFIELLAFSQASEIEATKWMPIDDYLLRMM